MKPIGIIANPASGKDIRRLVAYGSVFDNAEKTNIVKRILIALDALQVRDVFIMPDSFGIGRRAMEDIDVSSRDAIPINCDADNMIALDGEREIEVYQGDKLSVGLNPDGPWVVDVAGVLSIAATNKDWITVG